ATAVAALGLLGAGIFACQLYIHFQAPPAGPEEPFDYTAVPLVSDRVRESLSNYDQKPDFKSVAVARGGEGVPFVAADVESAKREAIERCTQRDQKGYCRTYAVGNKVVWVRPPFPLAADVRLVPLDTPFTADDIKLLGWAFREQQYRAYMERP